MEASKESVRTEIPIVLIPISELRPHEKGLPAYLEILKREILRDGILKYPLIADEETYVILDGMHRWLVLRCLGYSMMPCILVNSCQKLRIRVGRRRIDQYRLDLVGEIGIGDVISAGVRRNLLKPRSTRHFFPFSKYQRIDYPLRMLGKGSPQDVSAYLASVSKRESALTLKAWLEELSEELDFLVKRKKEVEHEMEDFQKRINHWATHSGYLM